MRFLAVLTILLACGNPPPRKYGEVISPNVIQTGGGGGSGLPIVNVKDLGAKGDGTTDDSLAIRAALSSVCSTGGTLYSPPGTYIVNRDGSNTWAINLPCGNLTLLGVPGQTVWKLHAGQPIGIAVSTLEMQLISNVVVRDMTIDGNWGNVSTQIDHASHGVTLPASTINVISTAGFPGGNETIYVEVASGPQAVTCTGTTATSFTGCSGGSGTMLEKQWIGYDQLENGINHGTTGGHTTTITSGSNGQTLPQATLNVASTTGFSCSGIAPCSLTIPIQKNVFATVSCQGKTSTTFTTCSGGSGTLTTGIEVYDSADPQGHGIMLRGTNNVLIQNTVVRQAYGDCVWIGASGTGLSIGATNTTIKDSQLDFCARQGLSFSQLSQGTTITNVRFTNVFDSDIDTEPVDTGTRDVTIEGSYFGRSWDAANTGRSGNVQLTIEGGKVLLSGQSTNSRNFNVHDNTFYGPILIENAENVHVHDNTIVTDFAGYSYAPVLVQMFADDVWIQNNHIYDRTTFPLANSAHDASIQVQAYVAGAENRQPTGVHIIGNDVHARNGRYGIRVSGTGGMANSTGAIVSSVTGTSTTVTSNTLIDTTATWTTNEWLGWSVYSGGVVAEIQSNTDCPGTCTLTLYQPAYPRISPGSTWYTPLGEMSTAPPTGTYVITQRTNLVDVDSNFIDLTDDGNVAGSDGIHVDAARAGMRVRVRNNTIKNANPSAISIAPVDANRKFLFLQITDNHGFDDQISHTCAQVVNFTSAPTSTLVAKMVLRGNINDSGCAAVTAGATSGTWLLEDGKVQQWTGFGSPEGVVSASIGATYQRIDGGTSTTLYIKEAGSGNTGWTALGGSVGATLPVYVSQLKLLGANYDPVALSATAETITAGTVFLYKIRAFGAFSKVLVQVGVGVAGADHAYVGIYKSDGTQAADMATATVDAATTLGSSQVQTVTLANTVTPTIGDDVYVAILVTGTPSPALTLKAIVGNSSDNGNLTASQGFRSCTSGSSLTSLPGSITLSGTSVANTMAWVGLQ